MQKKLSKVGRANNCECKLTEIVSCETFASMHRVCRRTHSNSGSPMNRKVVDEGGGGFARIPTLTSILALTLALMILFL